MVPHRAAGVVSEQRIRARGRVLAQAVVQQESYPASICESDRGRRLVLGHKPSHTGFWRLALSVERCRDLRTSRSITQTESGVCFTPYLPELFPRRSLRGRFPQQDGAPDKDDPRRRSLCLVPWSRTIREVRSSSGTHSGLSVCFPLSSSLCNCVSKMKLSASAPHTRGELSAGSLWAVPCITQQARV